MVSPYIAFTVSFTGESAISGMLQERLKEKYPNVIIYDRDEEAKRAAADDDLLFIPQVAYMEILFSRKGDADVTLIRCFHQHRFFNYDMSEVEPGSRNEKDMLDKMMAAVEDLWQLPKENPIQRYVEPESETIAETTPDDEQGDQSTGQATDSPAQEAEES